jgi:hypothetical protein
MFLLKALKILILYFPHTFFDSPLLKKDKITFIIEHGCSVFHGRITNKKVKIMQNTYREPCYNWSKEYLLEEIFVQILHLGAVV